MTAKADAPPEGLRAPAAALWRELRGQYPGRTLSVTARTHLELLAQASNRLAQMSEELDQTKLAVKGSRGQLRPHPLLTAEGRLREEIRDALLWWERICASARGAAA